jgi:hypothetical protein
MMPMMKQGKVWGGRDVQRPVELGEQEPIRIRNQRQWPPMIDSIHDPCSGDISRPGEAVVITNIYSRHDPSIYLPPIERGRTLMCIGSRTRQQHNYICRARTNQVSLKCGVEIKNLCKNTLSVEEQLY